MAIAEIAFLGGLAAVALWQRHIVLYMAAFIGLLLYGLQVADSDIKLGIPILLFGGFFLYRSWALWSGR